MVSGKMILAFDSREPTIKGSQMHPLIVHSCTCIARTNYQLMWSILSYAFNILLSVSQSVNNF